MKEKLCPWMYPICTKLCPWMYPIFTKLCPWMYPICTKLCPRMYPIFTKLCPWMYPHFYKIMPMDVPPFLQNYAHGCTPFLKKHKNRRLKYVSKNSIPSSERCARRNIFLSSFLFLFNSSSYLPKTSLRLSHCPFWHVGRPAFLRVLGEMQEVPCANSGGAID